MLGKVFTIVREMKKTFAWYCQAGKEHSQSFSRYKETRLMFKNINLESSSPSFKFNFKQIAQVLWIFCFYFVIRLVKD